MIPISDPIFIKGMVYAAGPRRVREILDAEAQYRQRERDRAEAELLALPLDEMMCEHGVAGWKPDLAVTPPVADGGTVSTRTVAGGVAGTPTVSTEVLAPSPPASTSEFATRGDVGSGRRPFFRRRARA